MTLLSKLWEWYIGLSPSIKSTIILTIILLIIIVIIHFKLKKYDETKAPHGIVLICEMLIDFMNGFTKNMVGKYWRGLAPYLTTIAVFITLANFSGLLGIVPPTASLSVTLTLGLMTFFLINFYGVKSQGLKKHLGGLLDPNPILLPLNIISEVVTPFSMGLRLFGNILSGAIIMTLIYGVFASFGGIWTFVPICITPVFHAIFDIAFGLIQTVVFLMLTAVFIANKLPEEDLEVK